MSVIRDYEFYPGGYEDLGETVVPLLLWIDRDVWEKHVDAFYDTSDMSIEDFLQNMLAED